MDTKSHNSMRRLEWLDSSCTAVRAFSQFVP